MKKLQRPRDKGRHISGQIIKGSSQPKFTAPSIPSKSKHEIAYKQTTSAFGTCSQRFNTNTSLDASTGPGSYEINVNPQNPSFSKKGFGPMLSRMARTLSLNFRRGPSPAQYSRMQTTFLDKHSLKRTHKFSKSEAHGPFWSQMKDKINSPGPFEYSQLKVSRASNLSSSSFRSSIKRWKQKAVESTPAPSSYDPKQTLVSRRPKGIVIKQQTPLSKQNILETLFGRERERNGPGQYYRDQSPPKPLKVKQTSGFKFLRHPIANLSKLSSLAPNPNYKEFLEASVTARSKGHSSKEYNSAYSLAKAVM